MSGLSQTPQPDHFAAALESLKEWDRQSREAYLAHMAELAELRAAFDEAMK